MLKFLLLLILISLPRISPTNAYFSSTVVVSDNSFTLGYWSTPTSEIVDLEPAVSRAPISINFTASDAADIDYVRLCYSFNLSQTYTCPDTPDYKSTTTSFNFPAVEGDGVYGFYTQVISKSGQWENLDDLNSKIVFTQLDSTPPAAALDLNELSGAPTWQGQNLLKDGSFESEIGSASAWYVSENAGSHKYVTSGVDLNGSSVSPLSGSQMLELGFYSSGVPGNSKDAVAQIFPIPQNFSGNISFNYRFFSRQSVDFSRFYVNTGYWGEMNGEFKTAFVSGALAPIADPMGAIAYDSGWQQLLIPIRYSTATAGKNVTLMFGVEFLNNANPIQSWAYVDDVRINSVDLRVGDTTPVTLVVNDIGTGSDDPTPVSVESGDNQIAFDPADIAGNSGIGGTIVVVASPEISLNKIYIRQTPQRVELFNNTLSDINLSDWYLQNQNGDTMPFTDQVSIGATHSLVVNLSLSLSSVSDSITLYKKGQVIAMDTYTIKLPVDTPTDFYLARIPDGVGTWTSKPVGDEPFVSIDYRPAVNKITFSVSNIPTSLQKLNYEIIYTSSGVQKGISGVVDSTTFDNFKSDRDFFLGTCSWGGCTPDEDINPFMIVVLKDENQKIIFNKTLITQ